MPDLSTRNLQPELMDTPTLDATRFVGSLVGLGRVNRVARSARILWPDLLDAARGFPGRPLRVLDIACGGGDVLIDLGRYARRADIAIEWHGCDVNPLAVEHAHERAKVAGLTATFFTFDAVRDALPDGFDVLMCSLFLHHLNEDDAVAFLRACGQRAANRVLVHDLVRSPSGYLLARVGVRALLCNDVCRVDGPRSVEGAFTVGEARALAEHAGLNGATVQRRFPERYLLRWIAP